MTKQCKQSSVSISPPRRRMILREWRPSLTKASLKAAAKMILAGSEEELAALKTKTMDEFRSLGIDKVHDWYASEWEQAKEKADTMGN